MCTPSFREPEMRWLSVFKEDHRGKWVVVEGDTLIASEDTACEAIAKSKLLGIKVPFLVHIPKEDELPFGGW